MQQTLEVRLSEAENAIKSAELEKIEKENAAMEALTEQELVMEKVLQESKILNQQAEDNVKVKLPCLVYLGGDWYSGMVIPMFSPVPIDWNVLELVIADWITIRIAPKQLIVYDIFT